MRKVSLHVLAALLGSLLVVGPGCGGNSGDCGNEALDGTEECDDGNTVDGDGCSASCLNELVCGDGVVVGDEECDDGNTEDGDGCSATCATEAACGDDVVGADEECDDGNTDDGDGCSATCTLELEPECGNGDVEGDEECDDGDTDNTDECTNACTAAVCGDGTVQAGVEDCDDADTDDTDGCVSCVDAVCGDSHVRAGVEDCDDGNMDNTDDCLDTCVAASCGDGQVQADVEECDDGDDDQDDGCLNDCTAATCGDGELYDDVEACDDGNNADGDGCDSDCTETACGNGIVTDGEACDDGNDVDGDGCTATCADEFCGDGVVNDSGTETCDDGNDEPGDCCDACSAGAGCEIEPNDTLETANDFGAIAVASRVGAHTSPEGDEDWFAFTVPAGADLLLSVRTLDGPDGTTCVGNFIDTAVTVYDAEGNSLGTNDDADSTFCSRLELPVTAGDYFILVNESPLTGPSVYDYTIEIDVGVLACGDDVAQGPEFCDGSDVRHQTCELQGFHSGTLSCNGTCDGFDTSACVPFVCGDGVRNGLEFCDGPDLGFNTCENLGFQSGALACASTCDDFDTSGCVPFVCGNAVAEGTEECDGTDLRGQSCTTVPGGFEQGALTCTESCLLDVSACTLPVCGNGVRGGGEQCDDGNTDDDDGCSSTCTIEGGLTESEPNEDGSASPGGGSLGNDFSIVSADGPVTGDIIIAGAILPEGDEDVFAITNGGGSPAAVTFETWGVAGPGTCGFDTVLHIRDAGGMILASDDDGGVDFCSLLTYTIPAGGTVYLHVLRYGDFALIDSYFVSVSYP